MGRLLEGTGFQMFKMFCDFPQEIIKCRKAQLPVFKKSWQNGMKASLTRIQLDELFINDKVWNHEKPFEADDQTDE